MLPFKLIRGVGILYFVGTATGRSGSADNDLSLTKACSSSFNFW